MVSRMFSLWPQIDRESLNSSSFREKYQDIPGLQTWEEWATSHFLTFNTAHGGIVLFPDTFTRSASVRRL